MLMKIWSNEKCQYKDSINLGTYQDVQIFDDHDKQKLKLKSELQELIQQRTEAAIFRCRSQWLEEGEKPTAYFLSLEKQNYLKKTIFKLRHPLSNEIVSDPDLILQILTDYFTVIFKEKEITIDHDYIGLSQVPQITEFDNTKLEAPLQLYEVYEALKHLNKNKCPGSDGLTPEFYLKFWHLLGKPMYYLYNQNIKNGIMHSTARDGIISLLD